MSALKTPADLAEQLQVSARQVVDWCKHYDWPHVRIGRSIRFEDSHVAEIIAKHTVVKRDQAAPGTVVIAGQTRRSARRAG